LNINKIANITYIALDDITCNSYGLCILCNNQNYGNNGHLISKEIMHHMIITI